MRRFIEKLAEGALTLSGSVTSITILLIVLFLFKEGSGLFNSPVIEEGYVLAVNSENPVEKIGGLNV
ncbi:MAG: phosphate ABC transporter permease subunit PstC, partial [Tannerellaceae bacterium]